MKKSDAQKDTLEYASLITEAHAFLSSDQFLKGYKTALKAFEYVPGMVHHETKHAERQLDSVSAIEIVCEFAPYLLDTGAIDDVDALLKKKRTIDRDTDTSLSAMAHFARAQISAVHAIWHTIEIGGQLTPESLIERLPYTKSATLKILNKLVQLGILESVVDGSHTQLQLTTDMQRPQRALCPACGARVTAPKSKLLDENNCPKCANRVSFVITDL